MTDVHSSFRDIFAKLQEGDYSSFSADELDELLLALQSCMEMVDTEALFSTNEELDDIATESLKFLALNYFYAKCKSTQQKMEDRRDNLLAAKTFFLHFLDVCKSYTLLDKSELRKVEGDRERPLTAEEKRNFKIDKFRREKTAKQRMQEINRLLRISKPEDGFDYEEERRELYVLMIQSFARDTIDELDLLQEELSMLQMREVISQEPAAPPSSSSMREAGSSGISVTRTYKVGDQLMFSRETVKSSVFGMGIAPPTMSLEEFGDLERAAAMERSAQEANSESGATKRYKDLVQAGLEDDDELLDAATEADRAWDDWKDQNPRGWGNKMGKRF